MIGLANSRIEVIQRLFGRGFIHPGGAEQMAFVQAVWTDAAAIGHGCLGGLGGGPAALAEFFGVWVTAFEHDSKLAGGSRRSMA